jgi:predicted nucleotidyltransferase component of viral defense system
MGSDQQIIEIFHLTFLKALSRKIETSLYVLKGGCNLRFFFKSIRYSEDIDFDVATISKETLRKNVNKLLTGLSFQQILSGKGIEIVHLSEPKQTETTQRWKLGVRLLNSNRTISTKIEFSRRKMDEGYMFEPVDSQLIQRYKLQPSLCNHYIEEIAFVQKVNALIHRTETQARDVFDMKLLLDRGIKLTEIQKFNLNVAVALENAMSIGFSQYKGQVVAYLLPEYQEYYDSEKTWNEIQEVVIAALESLLP